jgi:hypothetical protein
VHAVIGRTGLHSGLPACERRFTDRPIAWRQSNVRLEVLGHFTLRGLFEGLIRTAFLYTGETPELNFQEPRIVLGLSLHDRGGEIKLASASIQY